MLALVRCSYKTQKLCSAKHQLLLIAIGLHKEDIE